MGLNLNRDLIQIQKVHCVFLNITVLNIKG